MYRVRVHDEADLIRLKPLAKKISVNEFTLRRWWKAGKFPKPIRLGEQVVAWRMTDVENWLRQREAG